MSTIVGWNDGKSGIGTVVFWPAATLTPVICLKYPTPPPTAGGTYPSSATVYVPGASPPIVFLSPGRNFTVVVVGPVTTTRPESMAPALAGIRSRSPPLLDGSVESMHANTPIRETATTRITGRIGVLTDS